MVDHGVPRHEPQRQAERQQERTARRQAQTRIAELEGLLRERDAGRP